MTLEQQVLARVVPTDEEEARLRATVEDVLDRVRAGLRRNGIEGDPLLVGSVAKGTHLTDAEIDIFVRFSRDVPRDVLERVGLDLGAFLEKKVRMYAEHPFTRGWWKGFEVEVVPCYRITDASEKMSAVDRTPLHAEYVLERLGQEQRNEVRLLKAFCEGVGVYGAEAKVQGLSGYLCELLVLAYGSFRDALKASQRWRRGEVITLEEPPSRSFSEPLVFVDPVDAGRNVASAVGDESLATFRHAAKAFLSGPKPEFFFPPERKPITASRARALLKSRGTTLAGVVFPAPDRPDDIVYPQVRKAQRSIEELWRKAGFRVARTRAGVVDGRVVFLFEFSVFTLPAVEKHGGPPYWVSNSEDFLRRWSKDPRAVTPPYFEGDRWVVDVRREATDALSLLRAKIGTLSLGVDLDKTVAKARMVKDAKVLVGPYLAEVGRLLEPRFPWEGPTRSAGRQTRKKSSAPRRRSRRP